MSHTPGPWEAEINNTPPQRSFYIKSKVDNRKVATYLAYDDHMRFMYDVAKPEDVEDNARLIAIRMAHLLAACRLGELVDRPTVTVTRK